MEGTCPTQLNLNVVQVLSQKKSVDDIVLVEDDLSLLGTSFESGVDGRSVVLTTTTRRDLVVAGHDGDVF